MSIAKTTLEGNHSATLEWALEYRRRGYWVVPTIGKDPEHLGKGWQKLRLDEEQLRGHFSNGHQFNVGVLVGPPSGGLVDMDCDQALAAWLAALLAPATGSIFGHVGKPRSHRLYVCAPCVATTKKFIGPDRATLIELRAQGQTVFPGSVWVDRLDPSRREPIVWESDQPPAGAAWDDLERCCERIAAAILLEPCWRPGSRHDFTLALAGALLRRGWSVAEVTTFIEAIMTVAPPLADNNPDKIRRDVEDTAANLAAGKKTTGVPHLDALVNDRRAMALIARWLRLGRLPVLAPENVASATPPADGDAALAAHRDLLYNPHLSTSEKIVLVDLVERAGFRLGDTIPEIAPIGGIKDEDKTRCGVGLSSVKATLAKFKEWGILSAESRPPAHGAGHPWDYLYLHGDAINRKLRELGAGHKPARERRVGASATTEAQLRTALLERERQLADRDRELDRLRLELRHARTCDYCGSVLSARERACDGCRPTVPGVGVNKATKGAA